MAPGCFSVLWCCRWPPSPSNDGIVTSDSGSPSDNRDIRDATAIETTLAGNSPSPGHVNVPVPAPTQGLPTATDTLSPALTDVQPTVPHRPEGTVDVPVLAHVEEVLSASSTPHLRLDAWEARNHIDRISRFRILVMGRANAGKTTILQRVCNTTDQPEIFNGKGEKVKPTVVEGRPERGYHNIEDELVFKSNPGFVFHDSCGFEAGSEEQFDMMKKFVMDRAKSTKLDERIHAIWFCIPLNESHRMIMAAETKFFDNCDTGHGMYIYGLDSGIDLGLVTVPVIVLATKADTLELDAFEQLEDQGLSVDDAVVEKLQKEMTENNVEKLKDWLGKTVFPPHGYLSLTGMQNEGADCTPLLTCTTHTLDEEGLQQLLISTQQSNLELCMEYAIIKTLKGYMKEQQQKLPPETIAFSLSRWFPFGHWWKDAEDWADEEASDRDSVVARVDRDVWAAGLGEEGEEVNRDSLSGVGEVVAGGGGCMLTIFTASLLHFDLQMVDDYLVPPISHHRQSLKIPTFSTSRQYSRQYIAEHGIGTLLVFEYLYFLLQVPAGREGIQEDLNLAAKEYQSSGIHAKVNKLIQEALQSHGDNVEILCLILVKIAQQNQLSKMLNRKG